MYFEDQDGLLDTATIPRKRIKYEIIIDSSDENNGKE